MATRKSGATRSPPAQRFRPPTGSASHVNWYERPPTRGHCQPQGVERRTPDGKIGRAKTKQFGKKGFRPHVHTSSTISKRICHVSQLPCEGCVDTNGGHLDCTSTKVWCPQTPRKVAVQAT